MDKGYFHEFLTELPMELPMEVPIIVYIEVTRKHHGASHGRTVFARCFQGASMRIFS